MVLIAKKFVMMHGHMKFKKNSYILGTATPELSPFDLLMYPLPAPPTYINVPKSHVAKTGYFVLVTISLCVDGKAR